MEELNFLDAIPMDLVLSAGPACRPAQQIKAAGLRFTSAPMDWMELYPLSAFLHIFATKYEDFFTEIEEEPQTHGKNRRVVDTKNNITSIHHFPVKKSLSAGQKAMRKTMLRRAERIDGILQQAKHVLIVCNRPDSPESLEKFRREFQTIYPHLTCYLMNIRDTDTDFPTVTAMNDGKLLEIAFRDVHPEGDAESGNPLAWQGNSPYWQAALGHVQLSDAAKNYQEPKGLLEKLFRR